MESPTHEESKRDANEVIATQVDVCHVGLPSRSDGHAGENGLDAIKEDRERQEKRELFDGLQNGLARSEDESNFVVEYHDQKPEKEPYHHRRNHCHGRCKPRSFSVPGSELVRYSHSEVSSTHVRYTIISLFSSIYLVEKSHMD